MRPRARRRTQNSAVYKLCSLLLCYPDEQLLEDRGELLAAVRGLAPCGSAQALERFAFWWVREDPLALQQHYVETFDLHRRASLYLTFYGEGDTRRRGLALLRLARLYRAAGLPPRQTGELPDYLPAMLEFAASAPFRGGEVVLGEHRAAIELLRQALRARGTPYAQVLDAVCLTLGQPSAADRARAVKLAAGGPPQERVGLEPFGPPEMMPPSAFAQEPFRAGAPDSAPDGVAR